MKRWSRALPSLPFLLFLTVGACGGSSSSGGPDSGDAGDAGDAADAPDGPETGAAASCVWDPRAPELVLPQSEVRGALGGPSRNASTTCTRQRGTGGPDAVYLVQLRERTVLELEVVSSFDTVLAVRRVCNDPLTELACNDTPAPIGGVVDAGPSFPTPFPPDAAVPDSRDARLRVALDPGAYFVVVDEAEPFGVGGTFLLKVKTSSPPPQARCLAAATVADGASFPAEQLDLASEPSPACHGGIQRNALFYNVVIPGGQRLTARVRVTGGDRAWTPVIQLLSACATTDGLCLGTGQSAMNGDQVLRYVNNAATEQVGVIAVSAGSEVAGAMYRFDVSVAEPTLNGSCTSARPLSDGQVLRNQDLAEGDTKQTPCGSPGGPALYYSVRLLPFQRLAVHIAPRLDPFFGAPLAVTLREGCQAFTCEGFGTEVNYTNGPVARTMVMEVGTFFGVTPPVFDMTVELPLPPGAIEVSPTSGLVTSETGREAVFDVKLISPPREPVTIPISSVNTKEGTVRPAALTFTPANWETPQRVTVTGVDDTGGDGSQAYVVRVETAVSNDPRYHGHDPTDVAVINLDDEPGFRFVGVPIGTSELGGISTVQVFLNRAPAATVRLPLASSDEGEGKVSATELVFAPATWDQPQSFQVTGTNDDLRDGTQSYRIITGVVTSTDPAWAGLDPGDLDAHNADDDFQAIAAQAIDDPALGCSDVTAGQRLAVDQGGTLYALLLCHGTSGGPGVDGGPRFDAGAPPPFDSAPAGPRAYVVSSRDGGQTFQDPRAPATLAYVGQVAGGPFGHAALLVAGATGIELLRTEDVGIRWETTTLASGGSGLQLASNGMRLVAFAHVAGGVPTLWSSADFGRTWKKSGVLPAGDVTALSVQADGTIWMASYDGSHRLQSSSDGGATFDGGPITVPTENFGGGLGLGKASFFAGGFDGNLTVVPFATPLAAVKIPGLSEGDSGRIVAVHPNDAATVVEPAANSNTAVARHLKAGAQMFSTRAVGLNNLSPASAVALSNDAVAVMLYRGGRVWLSVEVFP